MSIESVFTTQYICDLFGVVVRTLNAMLKIMSYSDVHEEFVSEEMCTEQ
jgi:hypothetical protein